MVDGGCWQLWQKSWAFQVKHRCHVGPSHQQQQHISCPWHKNWLFCEGDHQHNQLSCWSVYKQHVNSSVFSCSTIFSHLLTPVHVHSATNAKREFSAWFSCSRFDLHYCVLIATQMECPWRSKQAKHQSCPVFQHQSPTTTSLVNSIFFHPTPMHNTCVVHTENLTDKFPWQSHSPRKSYKNQRLVKFTVTTEQIGDLSRLSPWIQSPQGYVWSLSHCSALLLWAKSIELATYCLSWITHKAPLLWKNQLTKEFSYTTVQ